MKELTFLVRSNKRHSYGGAMVALVVIMGVGVVAGPTGFGPHGPSAEAALPSVMKRLTASDAEGGDNFGQTVAISGDTAIVGSSRLPRNAGAAYIFQRDEGGTGNWGEVKKLTASDGGAGDGFGRYVAISGETAVVGAPAVALRVGSPDVVGSVYIFERDEGGAGNWDEVKKLTASDAQAGDVFGKSVSISGDTAVVGTLSEAAYVFGRDEGGAGNWGEVKRLTASDAHAFAGFGGSVAISGDTAVVSASGDDAGGERAGAAYVFQRDEGGAGSWGEVKKLTASDADAFAMFGLSVAVSGDTAVVGSINDAAGNLAGAAYVFQRNQGGPGNWGEVKKLISPDLQRGDLFGDSVAVSGDTAIVGALHEDAGADAAGAAYVFERNQGGPDNWGEVQRLTASAAQHYGQFGQSVAVSGDTALVGADAEDVGASGAAYVLAVGSSGGNAGLLAGMAAALVAGALALGGAAWYARRRWARR